MTPPAAAAAATGRVGSYSPPVPARPSRRADPARAPRPNRPSAPARPARARPSRSPHAVPAQGAARAETLAGSRLLDRLIRSRVWIALVAFALIGIVGMQLWMLKLNGGIGRAIEHESYLQRANAALSAENSAMSAGDLVERRAVANGMTIVAPGALVFLHTRRRTDEHLAAARLAQPAQAPTAGTEGTSAASQAVAASTAGTEGTSAASQAVAASTAGTETTQAAAQPAATPSSGTEATQSAAQPATAPSSGTESTSTTTQPEPGG
jgi:hypothetical protein